MSETEVTDAYSTPGRSVDENAGRYEDAKGGGIGEVRRGKGLKSQAQVYVVGRAKRGELAPATVTRIRGTLAAFCAIYGDRPVDQLSRKHIEHWLEVRAPQLRAGTLRTEFSTVRTFCRWLVLEGRVRRDPTIGVRPPRVPRAVPRALAAPSVAAALAACPGPRERLMVWLMVGLGLRRAEVANLQAGDIDLGRGVIYVKGKGGHTRDLPLTPAVRQALVEYAGPRLSAGPVIRSSIDGRSPIKPGTVGVTVFRLMKAAGVDGSCHAFRHTCLSDLAEQTRDLRLVQEVAGHATLMTTQVYLRRANIDGMREALSGLSYEAS